MYMDNSLDEQIKKRLAELPEDVRLAVQASDLGDKINSIGSKHQLHIDQVGVLEDEIMLVMLGFTDPGGFTSRIQQGLHIDQQEAAQLTEEVSEQFFLPLRESMQMFMAAQSASHTLHAAAESPAPPTSTLPKAEVMLAEKTATSVPKTPTPPAAGTPTPRAYTKDPYREPPE